LKLSLQTSFDLSLDRMEIEEAGPNPSRMADALVRQLDGEGRVPVMDVAVALDIIELRKEPLYNLEGALLTDAERSSGAILFNATSRPHRQRFTVAHELCHFLNIRHRQTRKTGFSCSRSDMNISRLGRGHEENWHRQQELEANRFAIELLVPTSRLGPFLRRELTLENVLEMNRKFDVSREAAGRRLIENHDEIGAIAFSEDGRLRYVITNGRFPRLSITKDASMPASVQQYLKGPTKLMPLEEADPADWLREPDACGLFEQTLVQRNGHAMTLLVAENDDTDEDDGLEDAASRFDRLQGLS
jgi:hypothetical protein